MYSLAHVLHLLVLVSVCYLCVTSVYFYKDHVPGFHQLYPDSIFNCLLYLICILGVISRLHMTLINIFGLTVYECFPGPVQLKADWSKLPRISFRIVTRGDYRDMVWENTKLIKSICYDVGLKNFIVEVVTEKDLGLPRDSHVTQILVPKEYKTKSGALFKGRNLQYCLEDGVSSLEERDWIVHLDEDTTPTIDSIKGIANFIQKGKYQCGQGRITYDPENVTGTMTQLVMANRTVFDYGLAKVSCKAMNRFWSVLKGSFVACNVGLEKRISFDNGLKSSVWEFGYFSFKANESGYRVGWIEGQMIELGTLTVEAYVSQISRISKGFPTVKEYWAKGNPYTLTIILIWKLQVLYLVSLTSMIFLDLPFLNFKLYLGIIGVHIAHDMYAGIFLLYKKYPSFSWKKIAIFLMVNLIVSPVYMKLIYFRCFKVAASIKGLSFTVTKKTL